jgi:outer membrane protein assembly factor BamB
LFVGSETFTSAISTADGTFKWKYNTFYSDDPDNFLDFGLTLSANSMTVFVKSGNMNPRRIDPEQILDGLTCHQCGRWSLKMAAQGRFVEVEHRRHDRVHGPPGRSENHFLKGINGADGILKWKYKTDGTTMPSPSSITLSVDGTTLFVGSDDTYLQRSYIDAISTADGSLQWRHKTEIYRARSSTLSTDGTTCSWGAGNRFLS